MYGGSLEAGTAVVMRPKMRIATPMMASEIHPILNRVLARLVIGPLEARLCPALPTPLSMPQNEAHRLSKEGLFTQRRRRGILRSSFAGSCIVPVPEAPQSLSKALRVAWEGSTCCGAG